VSGGGGGGDREGAGLDDHALLAAFEACAIPNERWTHREHLRVAYLQLVRRPYPEALARMRDGIRALNAANAVPEGLERGYHETVTVAWMRLIAAALRDDGPGADSRAFFAAHPGLGDKFALRRFYSRDRILTAAAKAAFVPPDLSPLPEPGA
jgi:hypothetical protein